MSETTILDFQNVRCACGVLQYRFNQPRLERCPACDQPLKHEPVSALSALESLAPRYHVKIEQPGDSGSWWCWIGKWSNIESTEWIAVHNGYTMEQAARNALARLAAHEDVKGSVNWLS